MGVLLIAADLVVVSGLVGETYWFVERHEASYLSCLR